MMTYMYVHQQSYSALYCTSKVKSCILDGEMVGWDPETESFL